MPLFRLSDSGSHATSTLDPLKFQFGLKSYEELIAGLRRGNVSGNTLEIHLRNHLTPSGFNLRGATETTPSSTQLEDSSEDRHDLSSGEKQWSSVWPWASVRNPNKLRDPENIGQEQGERNLFNTELFERSDIQENHSLLDKGLRERGLLKHELNRQRQHYGHVLNFRRLNDRVYPDEKQSLEDRDSSERTTEFRDLELREHEVEEYYRNKARDSMRQNSLSSSDYSRDSELRERQNLIRDMIGMRNGSDDPPLSSCYPQSSGEGGSTSLSGGSPPLTHPPQYSPDGDWYSPTGPLGSQIAAHLPSGSPKAERIFQVCLL